MGYFCATRFNLGREYLCAHPIETPCGLIERGANIQGAHRKYLNIAQDVSIRLAQIQVMLHTAVETFATGFQLHLVI